MHTSSHALLERTVMLLDYRQRHSAAPVMEAFTVMNWDKRPLQKIVRQVEFLV